MKKETLYLPNLNGVRAIAALMVIIFHIELIKSEWGFRNDYLILNLGGDKGVTLFFVLSGFLITYLLLKEEQITSKISLKNFYFRRILRIWPLYFFIVLSSLFILPHISFLYEPPYHHPYIKSRIIIVILYLLFCGNVLTALYSHVNFVRPTWSVSVEEQFYLIWPILLKFSKNKLKSIKNVFILYWTLRLISGFLNSDFFHQHMGNYNFFSILDSVIFQTPFDSLSIGGIAAYITWSNKTFILNFLYNKVTQHIIFISLPLLLYLIQFHAQVQLFSRDIQCDNLIFSLIFAAAIINLAGNQNVIISLENKILYHLGKISYGLYMYHWIAIVAVINLIKQFDILKENILIFNIVLYTASFGLVILISHMSFTYFEYKFIVLKSKFSMITSGDLVKKIKN